MKGALLAVCGLLLAAGCGNNGGRAEGEECFGTSECASGLICNPGENPRRCRQMNTLPDAAVIFDAAPAPDADPNAPDADPTAPDAMPGVPDAAVPDAAIPDAAIPDANLPDAT